LSDPYDLLLSPYIKDADGQGGFTVCTKHQEFQLEEISDSFHYLYIERCLNEVTVPGLLWKAAARLLFAPVEE
jgi:hypothetical protein